MEWVIFRQNVHGLLGRVCAPMTQNECEWEWKNYCIIALSMPSFACRGNKKRAKRSAGSHLWIHLECRIENSTCAYKWMELFSSNQIVFFLLGSILCYNTTHPFCAITRVWGEFQCCKAELLGMSVIVPTSVRPCVCAFIDESFQHANNILYLYCTQFKSHQIVLIYCTKPV